MNQSREVKAFIFGQYFSDGIRITFGVLLPSFLFAQLGQLALGVTISLGAFCISMADNPGPVSHKKNGMLFGNLFVFVTALLTGFINSSPILIGLEIVILSFFYSMFTVYGNRASTIGSAALLIMILSMDQHQSITQTWLHAVYILVGGIWYMVLSLLVSQIRPYRQAQQALAECIKEVGTCLRLKAKFYDIKSDYDENYKKLISRQITIHHQQDIIRELLFKSNLMVKESTKTGRLLILLFIDTVDLFEHTMAIPYDYHTIRTRYGHTNVLLGFEQILIKLGQELENLSYYITQNQKPIALYNFQHDLESQKNAIDDVEEQVGLNTLVLKKILINIRNMINRTQKAYSYFDEEQLNQTAIHSDLSKFVSHNDFDLKSFINNLNFNSSIFRYALRMSIVCLIGYLVSKLFPLGHHSYWILLTILVILKPDFSLTKKRNAHRLIGTIIGGATGVLLLIYVKNQSILFAVLLFCMIGTYSFQRLKYMVSVMFLTPYILILFNFLGANIISTAQERIIDTLVGSFIAFLASRFILPNWEHNQLNNFLKDVLVANYNYLLKVSDNINGKPWDVIAYKLVRRDVYVSSANIGSAFQRMLSEPKNKQRYIKEINEFLVLNHMLSAYISTLIYSTQALNKESISAADKRLTKMSLGTLNEIINRFTTVDKQPLNISSMSKLTPVIKKTSSKNYDQGLLTEQLKLVNKVIKDLSKINIV